MGKNIFLTTAFLFLGLYLNAQMILVYDTNLSWGTTITLPLDRAVNVSVDWGDGSSNQYNRFGYYDHSYAEEGVYTVTISGELGQFGNAPYIYPNADKLREVISFGDLGLTSLNGAFFRASNLVRVPNTLPSTVKTLVWTFSDATSFNHPIGEWDVSNVTDMSFAFYGASSFNQDISDWNVANVTNMGSMFSGCTSFNQDIGRWNVANVTDMNQMFTLASSFDQYIGNWDVSNVRSIFGMFGAAESFNQDIGKWDVGNVESMQSMFQTASSFNQDIGKWNVGKVNDMHGMFWGAESFDQDIGAWDMSNVASIGNMFAEVKLSTANYNGLLIGWAIRKLQPGLFLDVGYSQHSPGEAYEAKMHIMETYGWSFSDAWITTLPAIITATVSEITPATAVSGGKVSADGGYDITGRGIVCHTEANPTIDLHTGITQDGGGMGIFESHIEGLEIGTKYYVRAYASNSQGTAYGNTVQFRSTKELHLTGDFTMQNKIYDGTTLAQVQENNLVLVGILEEYADVFIDYIDISFDNAQVGDQKTASVIKAILKGNHANLYSLTLDNAPTATGKIEPRELKIGGTFMVADKLHDGTTHAIITENNLGLSTPVNSEDVSLTAVVAEFEDASEGNDKKVIITQASLEGNDMNNYRLTLDDSPVSSASIAMPGDSHMVLVFNTRLSDETTVSIPLYGDVDVTVYWGDGLSNRYTTADNHSHTYVTEGIYTVTIAGSCDYFGYFYNLPGIEKLVEVTSFGDLGITSFNAAFKGAINLVVAPDQLPSSVTGTAFMFYNTPSFNHDIGGWDISNVNWMIWMFGRSAFNQDISGWDVSNVTDMRYIFEYAKSFNQDISRWNVSNVTDMSNMFDGATSFNQDIGSWDVANVTTMSYMFYNATSFNQNIGGWDVGKVLDMSYMFSNATSFNQNIGSWNMGNATNIDYIFENATSFDQNIGGWDMSNVTELSNMFLGSKLSTASYDSLLIGWASQNLNIGVSFNAGSSQYSPGVAAQARQFIVDDYAWTITDGGIDTSVNISETEERDHLQVYPNPFQRFITVKSHAEISKMELLTITGQIVAVSTHKEPLGNNNLEDGVYFLRIEFTNFPPQVVKVIKN